MLETAKGPVVRVYEFDRIKNTTWQVDIMVDGIVTKNKPPKYIFLAWA